MSEPKTEVAELLDSVRSVESVSHDISISTPEQRSFAAYYVLTGGKATRAAKLAGYKSPGTMATKLRLNKRVMRIVEAMCIYNVTATLPRLIAKQMQIAFDDDQPTSQQLRAIRDLQEIQGIRRKGGGVAVAVQVNTGGEGAPTGTIQEIWNARAQRMSGIDDTMTDKNEGEEPPASEQIVEG